MRPNQTHRSCWHVVPRALSVAALTALLLAPGGAQARGVHLEAALPVIVPFELATGVALGVTPSVQVDLTSHLGLTFTSGAMWTVQDDQDTQVQLPLLLGLAYGFGPLKYDITPYVSLKAGYTRDFGGDGSRNWITLAAGGGVLWRSSEQLQLDLGFDLIAPDLRGNSPSDFGLLFKLGARFDVSS
jgi:hypothetical protein